MEVGWVGTRPLGVQQMYISVKNFADGKNLNVEIKILNSRTQASVHVW